MTQTKIKEGKKCKHKWQIVSCNDTFINYDPGGDEKHEYTHWLEAVCQKCFERKEL